MHFLLEHAPLPLLWAISVSMIALAMWDTWRRRDRLSIGPYGKGWKFYSGAAAAFIGFGFFELLPAANTDTGRFLPFSVMFWGWALVSAAYAIYARGRVQ